MAKYVTGERLGNFWTGMVTNLTSGVNGKKLTTNDLTDELKAQYDKGQANLIESIKVNNAEVAVDEGTKNISLTIPAAMTDFSDESSYYTSSEVDEKIGTALNGKMKVVITPALPDISIADVDTIYLLSNSKTEGDNVYDEYLVVNGNFEIVGSTAVKMSGLLKYTDVATDDDINEIFTK